MESNQAPLAISKVKNRCSHANLNSGFSVVHVLVFIHRDSVHPLLQFFQTFLFDKAVQQKSSVMLVREFTVVKFFQIFYQKFNLGDIEEFSDDVRWFHESLVVR